MFLSIEKNGTHKHVYLKESYKDANGRFRNRVVQKFGRLDAIDPSKLEELKQKYSNTETKRHAEAAQNLERFTEKLHRAEGVDETTQTHFNKAPMLQYGHLLLKPIWEDVMGCKYKFDHEQAREDGKHQYSFNDLAFYLSALKAMCPSSYYDSYARQSTLLHSKVEGIGKDSFYNLLDFIARHKDGILSYVTKRIHKNQKAKPKLLFYDCTNVYFETPYDDDEQFIEHLIRETRKELSDKGCSPDQIQEYLESDTFAVIQDTELNNFQRSVKRKRGPSKEGRFTLPLVSIALVIDSFGMPIDFEVYDGNASEQRTMCNSIKKLKAKYEINNVYVVADRGLNSTENLNMLLANNLGFIVAQTVTGQSAQNQETILNSEGWKTISVPKPEGFDKTFYCDEERSCPENSITVKYKLLTLTKEKRVPVSALPEAEKVEFEKAYEGKKMPKTKKIQVQCQEIVVFNEMRRRYELNKLSIDEAKARQAVAENKIMKNTATFGWRALVKTIGESEGTNDSKERYRAKELNTAVLENRKKMAGYSAFVYANPNTAEAREISIEEVLEAYHQEVRIEDCFRVLKSNLQLRPMFVRLADHIIGHCTICILSLIMLRVLEMKLYAMGLTNVSIGDICQELNNAKLVPVPGTYDDNIAFIGCKSFQDIYTVERVRKHTSIIHNNSDDGLHLSENQAGIMADWMQDREKNEDLIDSLTRAVGLKPLSLCNSLPTLNKCLKLKLTGSNCMNSIVHRAWKRANGIDSPSCASDAGAHP